MKSFFYKWGRYLSVIFSPDVVLSIIGAIIFGYWSTTTADTTAKTVGAVVMAILTGVAGARLAKMIIEDSSTGQIFTRGQSAVRGLGLILTNLGTLEAQLEKARAECNGTEIGKDFMYIKSLAVVIQRQAVNSMEEWKDILPEADIRKMIDDLSKKVSDADELRETLESVQAQLDKVQSEAGNTGEQLEKLKKQKLKLEKELKEKEREALNVLPSSFSGTTLFSPSSSSNNYLSDILISPSSDLIINETGKIKLNIES